MQQQWYVLRVVSGQEKKVVDLINTYKNDNLFEFSMGEVFLPEEEAMSTRNGKKYTRKKKVLPGYLFIELDLGEGDWSETANQLRSVEGVIGFAGATSYAQKPTPISEEEVRSMIQYTKESSQSSSNKVKQMFKEDEKVNIIDGPFNSFSGKIIKIDAEHLVLTVSVEIFGRTTPIEVAFHQVEHV